jgi:glycosyltransferase involved in cell wall biosynthesis
MKKSANSIPAIGVIGLKGLPAFGGAATAGENIVKRLKGEFDFVIYAVSSHAQPGYVPEGFRQIVFKAVPNHKLNIILYYFRSALHAVFSANYNLIHLHHIDGAFVLPLLRIRYKVISTAHGRTFESGKWPWHVNLVLKLNEQVFLSQSSCVTTVGRPLQETYRKITGKEIRHIPNGVDMTFRCNTPEPAERKGYLLFSAGRIIPLKGLHFLLDALHRIGYKQKLIVLGDLNQIPQYGQDLVKKAAGLHVEFKGMIRDKGELSNYIREAGLFIFPSVSETMSVMLLEVTSLLIPVICSDIRANKAVYSDQEVLYFRSEDVNDLAEKITWALENMDAMNEKACGALEKLRKEYDWDSIAVQYRDLYNEFINN